MRLESVEKELATRVKEQLEFLDDFQIRVSALAEELERTQLEKKLIAEEMEKLQNHSTGQKVLYSALVVATAAERQSNLTLLSQLEASVAR